MTLGLGYATIDKNILGQSGGSLHLKFQEDEKGFTVENRYYIVQLGKDGAIRSWKDKRTNFQREICKKGDTINKICLHEDVPFFWDAWDIMHHDFETGTYYKANKYEVTEKSDSSIKITFTYSVGEKSTFTQTVVFFNDFPRVDFDTRVDWHENKKLLKAYFPVDIRSDFATFDI